MAAPYRISIGVNIDPAGAKTGAREAVQTVNQISAAADRARPSVDKLVNAFVGLDRQGANSNGRAADIQAYGVELDRLRAKYNPLFATISNYKTMQAEIREAHKLGAISADEMTAALTRQRQATLAVIAAQKGRDTAGSGGNANDRFRRQNLTYQAFDVGQTLAGGMPLGMIAAQQGPQILQLYAGQGGLKTALKDIGSLASGATRMITPLTLGIGALTGAVATGALAYNAYLQSTKEVEVAASGLGRAVAGTKAEMEASAQAGAAAAGISVSSARSMEAAFLRTGRIGADNFQSLIAISKDFGATMGVAADDAGSMLAEMFADPAKAADTLFQKYGLIDAATARHASNLAAQNRLSEAQAVLLKALPNQLADASAATSALGRAWESVSRGASDAFDWMGKAVDRAVGALDTDERIAKLEGILKQPRVRGRENIEAELNDLKEQKRRQEQEAAEQKRKAEENRRSAAAVTLYEASPANSRAAQTQRLRNEIETLKSARGIEGIDAGQNEAAIEAKTRALEALITRQQRAAELDRLDIQIANERNPLLRAELEARRVRLQMAEQEVSTETIATEAARARNRVIEETIAGAATQAADMKAEAATRARLNALVGSGAITSAEANRMLQEEATLRPLVAAAALAEGEAKQKLEQQIGDLREGYAALAQQEKLASAQEYLRGNQEKFEQLKLQQSLIGQNVLVQQRANALLEAEQRIRREGLDTNGSIANAMRDQADAMATLNREIERQAEAWDQVKTSLGNAIDDGIDKLMDGDFKGALESAADEVKSLLSDLAFKNPLKNALLGDDNPTLQDVGGLGGIFSRLFGGQKAADPKALVGDVLGKSVGTMSVTAATVMINGGVAGGLGAAGGASGLDGMLRGLGGGAANSNIPAVTSTGKAVDLASGLLGTNERTNSLDINAFLHKGGVDIDAAQTAWCAGFVNSALKQIGVKGTGSLAANSFQNWGSKIDPSQIMRGDVLLQTRGLGANQAGGHVGFATGQTRMSGGNLQLEMLSGNYKNGVGTGWLNASELQARRATEALGGLAGASGTATQGLGNLGANFDQFGRNLANAFPSAPSGGGGGGFFSKLFSGLFGGGLNQSILNASPQIANVIKGGGVGLFADGGSIVGPGGPRDDSIPIWASNGEFMVNAKAAAQYRPWLEAINSNRPLRAFRDGGYVSTSPVYPSATAANSNGAAGSSITVNNYSSARVETEETRDEKGNRHVKFVIADQVGAAMAQPGGGARRHLETTYGMKPKAVRR